MPREPCSRSWICSCGFKCSEGIRYWFDDMWHCPCCKNRHLELLRETEDQEFEDVFPGLWKPASQLNPSADEFKPAVKATLRSEPRFRSISDCIAETKRRNAGQSSREDGGLRAVRMFCSRQLRYYAVDDVIAGRNGIRTQAILDAKTQRGTPESRRQECLRAPKVVVVGWYNRHLLRPALAGKTKEQRAAAWNRIETDVLKGKPKQTGRVTVSEHPTAVSWPDSKSLKEKKSALEANAVYEPGIKPGRKNVARSISHALELNPANEKKRQSGNIAVAMFDYHNARKELARLENRTLRSEMTRSTNWIWSHSPSSIQDALNLTAIKDKMAFTRLHGYVMANVAEGFEEFKTRLRTVRSSIGKLGGESIREGHMPFFNPPSFKDANKRLASKKTSFKSHDIKAGARHKVHKILIN